MIAKVFSGHSVRSMPDAAAYALRQYDDYVQAHETHETEHISTAVFVEPFDTTFNYYYNLTVMFVELDPQRNGVHRA